MHLTTVRRAAVANLVGQAWALLLSLVMIPVYLRWMGVEVYGLLGVHLTLMAAAAVLDVGLSGTVNRELARAAATDADRIASRNVVRTLEVLVWPGAVLIGLAIAALSGWLATDWLRPVKLDADDVRIAIVLMGFAVGIQWPAGFYSSALAGLQRQVLLNVLVIVFSTLRSVGVLLPLLVWGPSVVVFFAWQAAIGLLYSVTMAWVVWHRLPACGARARFDRAWLRRVGRFAGGMAIVGAVSFVLMHMDRMVLSTALSLAEFGQYAIAVSLAAAIHRFIVPVQAAVYPRYSELVAADRLDELALLHHNTTQAVAVVVLPAVALMAVFSTEIIGAWTGNPTLGAAVGPILRLLVLGYALNGLMLVPQVLQMAFGATRLQVALLCGGLLIGAPAMWHFAHADGGVGAAGVWLALNALFVAVGVTLIHRRLLRGEARSWFIADMLPAVAVATTLALGARWLLPDLPHGVAGWMVLLALLLAGIGGAAVCTRYPRALLGKAMAQLHRTAPP